MRNVLRAIRARLVAVRDGVDGLLHARRRTRAIDRISSAPAGAVTFVCLGNVCRSPYAEWALRARLEGLEIRSAGFIGPGRAPPDEALDAARKRGIDHAEHRSRTLTEEDVRDSGVLVIFDRHNRTRLRARSGVDFDRVVWLGDLDPLWTGKRAVIDPWGRGPDFFDRTFERVDRCVDELAAALSPPGPGTSPPAP